MLKTIILAVGATALGFFLLLVLMFYFLTVPREQGNSYCERHSPPWETAECRVAP